MSSSRETVTRFGRPLDLGCPLCLSLWVKILFSDSILVIKTFLSNPFLYSFWSHGDSNHAQEKPYYHALTSWSRSFAGPMTQSGVLRDKDRADNAIP